MRVLLAEDDAELASRLAEALGEAGFAVDRAADGRDAEFRGQTEDYDAVVLDLGLPGMDGLSVLDTWRGNGRRMPVLVLTARGRWHDKLAGFDAGADDYLVKPFPIEELVLRLRALIRRSTGHVHPLIECGALVLDDNANRFTLAGEPLALTAQEQRILAYLMHRQGAVVSRAELGEHVYEQGYDPDSNALDVLIGRIRRKIGAARIVTERGKGFRLEALP
ncbi:response regulator transcription factor [Arenimonas fontis]|uniref:Response regulator transcription factor n=1 Tax=Arenimonas fontis TaxID=2608255 RepID=A0A5B2ZC56_9GAMM|nr:response regulator transcription factor [Arenimonas fontis]KAA2284701.1 response regulator transcription factor [Arenimonas fontis]